MKQHSTIRPRHKEGVALLPAFAHYLLENHYADFSRRCLRLYHELDVPLLAHLSQEEAEAITDESIRELLTALATHSIADYIHTSIEAFRTNQLPGIESNSLIVDDIIRINHARKQAFLDFIPDYSADPAMIVQLCGEIESYTHVYMSSAFKALTELTDRKLNDQLNQLEESERHYKQAQAITHLGNYTWDLTTDHLRWSDELYRIYGLDPAMGELPREEIASYNHPDDAEKVKEHIGHYRIVLPGGQVKTLRALGEVVMDESGKASFIFGTTQDVSEREHLLHTLQQNEHLYRQVESIAHVGGWYWNVAENAVSWTDELYRIYGLEPQSEAITFESYLELVHPEDRDLVTQTVQQAMQTGSKYTFHHRIRTREGKVKILHAQGEVITDARGRPVQLMGSAQDVTIQKKAEARLFENQHFIKKIADATPAIISTYQVDTGKYTFINQGVKKRLGYEPAQILQSSGIRFFSELIHPDDLGELKARNEKILREANQRAPGEAEEVFDYRYRIRHQKGHYCWLHTYGTVFERSKTNQVKQILNISLDITDRIEAEQVLLQRTRELRQSNASLEEFAYITSHDLKEPLRKISMFVERLTSLRASGTEEEKLYFDKIQSATIRMREMIDDILSLSLLSHKVTPEQVDLQKILDHTLYTFEEQLASKGGSVECAGLPVIRALPTQMDQLFQNLIGNSLKFSRSDVSPHIFIGCSFLKPAEVEVPVAPASRYVRLTFRDNGIGFDNAFQEKIFAVFQRLHHKHQYEGTGIGLAICKKIVSNHGGHITASGVVNAGAEFTIILPV
jgi:PAS domain S-box-containing protein